MVSHYKFHVSSLSSKWAFFSNSCNTYWLVVPHIKQSGDRPQKDLAQFGREVESCYILVIS
jgi:hypothetical protein